MSITRLEEALALYPRLVPLRADLHGPAAQRAADALTGPHQRVLDLAAGPAPWSLALAAGDSTTRVTAVDLPGVLAHTRRAVTQRGLEHRYRFVAGDAFQSTLDGPYDVVLVANFCHLFGAGTNLRLLRRLRRLLIPGGRLGIIDVVPGGAHALPSQRGLHAPSLLLRTPDGAAHHFSAYVDWLTRCDYRSIERVELDPPTPLTLVLATLD